MQVAGHCFCIGETVTRNLQIRPAAYDPVKTALSESEAD